MNRKVNNIEFKGNDHFFGQGKESKQSKSISPLFPDAKSGFGTLGNGILRPKKNPFILGKPNPYRPVQKFRPDGHLSDDEKLKRISNHVVDSLQDRIDEAINKQKVEQKQAAPIENTKEKESSGKSKWTVAIWVFSILCLAGMSYGVYSQLDFSKPKKA